MVDTSGLWETGFSLLGASVVLHGVKNIQNDLFIKERKEHRKKRDKQREERRRRGCISF